MTEHASSNKSLPIPKIPNLPKNIAAVPKPDKQEIIRNQISWFKYKCQDFLLTTFLLLMKKAHKHYLRCFNLSPLHCIRHSCYLTRDTYFELPIMHMIG